MLDLREVRDAVNAALADLPLAATWHPFISDVREMSPAHAQALVDRAVLIDDRQPDVRQEFAASLSLRREENARKVAELEIALDELR